jgi:hypothetical protein
VATRSAPPPAMASAGGASVPPPVPTARPRSTNGAPTTETAQGMRSA